MIEEEQEEQEKTTFLQLYKKDLRGKTHTREVGKTKLTYLTWSFAWAEFVKMYPQATYEVIKDNGKPYFSDESGAMCYTSITANNLTHQMWLPVMNGANKAMRSKPFEYTVKGWNGAKDTTKTTEAYTMFDINKTIMRCLVKNIAMFGLGLYIYENEDIPEAEKITKEQEKQLVQLISTSETTMFKLFTKLGWQITKLEEIEALKFDYVVDILEKNIKLLKKGK